MDGCFIFFLFFAKKSLFSTRRTANDGNTPHTGTKFGPIETLVFTGFTVLNFTLSYVCVCVLAYIGILKGPKSLDLE